MCCDTRSPRWTALQKGISLPTVQKILGHDSFQTTEIVL